MGLYLTAFSASSGFDLDSPSSDSFPTRSQNMIGMLKPFGQIFSFVSWLLRCFTDASVISLPS